MYDINNDGYITKEELIDIVTSIYDLMGDQTSPAIDDGTPVDHVERIFEVRACDYSLRVNLQCHCAIKTGYISPLCAVA